MCPLNLTSSLGQITKVPLQLLFNIFSIKHTCEIEGDPWRSDRDPTGVIWTGWLLLGAAPSIGLDVYTGISLSCRPGERSTPVTSMKVPPKIYKLYKFIKIFFAEINSFS